MFLGLKSVWCAYFIRAYIGRKDVVEVKLRGERAKVKTDERMDQTRTEQHLCINHSSLKEQN